MSIEQTNLSQPTLATATPNDTPIVLANPRGFCAGVDRAIIIVEQALDKFNLLYPELYN